ncbi:MAG: methionine adenosyltransferase [Paludibacteraceae bacterium]|nr:methionine adenosyltransferase [Paludibacteraceae bacterium]
MYLFTSESVSEGHPDKIADQISDAVLDNFLALDENSHVACETLVTTGQVVIAGEVNANTYIDIPLVARRTIEQIGYTKSAYKFEAESCGILTALHEQSSDINQGVSRGDKLEQGAGDQGMMFGYATNETDNYMPLTLDLAHTIVFTLAKIRKEGKQMKYLRPDAKSQVTLEYDDNNRPQRIQTIVVSTQHDPDVSQEQIRRDIEQILLPRVAKRDKRYKALFKAVAPDGHFSPEMLLVNPTGNFVIGGPHGDTGLTGRKIIVDTYGGRGAHGGGAFSGKDPSKVDRSAAYAARYIAKNLVAAGVADEVLVQLSYAIGVARPVSIYVNTNNTNKTRFSDSEIAERLWQLFDLRPGAIEQMLNLRKPIYQETAAYGHVGRTPQVVKKTLLDGNGKPFEVEVELFPWEKLDKVEMLRKEFL